MSASRRRLFAPEVVQTSAMDCGPAALKCLVEGFGIPVSYGRLREACQTDVDGTSIDAIEQVASQFGLAAEQLVLPIDHIVLKSARALPALVVVRHPSGGVHFVVVWRRIGGRLQLMDPATGRRWVRRRDFLNDVYRHSASVSASEWRIWAGSEAFLLPLQERLARIGGGRAGRVLLGRALADDGWFGLGALDASLRLVSGLIDAGGLRGGAEAVRLLTALFERTCASPFDIFTLIPPDYWSVTPDLDSRDPVEQRLVLRGAVLLVVAGRKEIGLSADAAPLAADLAAALREQPARPLGMVWSLLREDGVVGKLALAGGVAVAVATVLAETLLFRALFDISGLLTLGSQRLAAIGALLAFAAIVVALEIPIVLETMRLGRYVEVRLRVALLRKLPRLSDRYFQSRPISDMAERAHALYATRLLPGLAVHLVRSACELLLTLGAVILIDGRTAGLAAAVVAVAVGLPLATQGLIRERDLRARSHNAALAGFYLDALLGLVPVRAHRAERSVQRQHERLLTKWIGAARRIVTVSIALDAVQSGLGLGLAAALLFRHFADAGSVTGGDLLLVYWVLKLPAVGRELSALLQQIPGQQNTLARLMEPLSAPTVDSLPPAGPAKCSAATGISILGGSVVAGGHTILRDVSLSIRPAEHVAIVGASGAGKSTLIGLLLGWHRLAEGALLVDGKPMSGSVQEALRRHTAWVDPAIQIWNRSFVDNLGYASADGGLSRVGEVVDAAGLRGVLSQLPEGMQTRLGEGGALLSGGEGQRIRLGRAFAQEHVRLALLDEPFRGMDRDRRSQLLADARQRWADATLLCVTHDVGETRTFDRVLVVEDGRIVEDGAPSDLAAAPSRYARMLEAERGVLGQVWKGGEWRRLDMRDGRVEERA